MRLALCVASLIGFAAPGSAELSIPAGLSAAQAVENIALTGALAAAYASTCRSEGVGVLAEYETPNAQRDADFLVSRGYDRDEIYAAHNQLSPDKLMSDAVRYMLSKGVNLSDPNSICHSARQEIAEGSAVGKRLFVHD